MTLALQVLSRLELIQPLTSIKNVETNNKSNKNGNQQMKASAPEEIKSGPISRVYRLIITKAMLNGSILDRFPQGTRYIIQWTVALSEKIIDTARKKSTRIQKDLMH